MVINRRKFLQGAAAGALAGLHLDAARALGINQSVAQQTTTGNPGQWLQFRGDPALIGRSSLKGNIKNPAINWKRFCGGREALLRAEFPKQHNKQATVLLSGADLGTDPRVHPDERMEALASYNKYAGIGAGITVGKFLPGEPGLQILECESCFAKYASYQPPGTGEFVHLLTRRNGQWQEVWRSDLIHDLFFPNVITGDFDNDGKLELAFTPWYELWVMDMATGKLKSKCRFSPQGAESGRAYGYLGAFDIDGDGKQEFVLLPDFENQMAVIGWQDGNLKLLWNRLIERGIGNKKTLFQPGAQPVQDVDGDGKMEIIVSLYNATGDDKWHVLVIDAMTGQQRLDLADQHLTGMRDVDGDGIPELFLTTTQGRLIPEPAGISIISFKNGTMVRRWELENSAFQTRMITDYPAYVQNGTSTAGSIILAEPAEPGGLPVFFTRKTLDVSTGATELVAWQSHKASSVQRLGSFVGPYAEVLVEHPREHNVGALLVRAQIPNGHQSMIESVGISLQPVFSGHTGIPITTAVVGKLNPQSAPSILVEGAEERIQAFRPGQIASLPEIQWKVRARSIHSSSQSAGGVVLADLRGDGRFATLAATTGSNDCARMIAVDSEGKEIWGHDFVNFPGATPAHNLGGLFFWFAGHFTDPNRNDVLVTLARAQLHSEETFLLDGRNGEEIWHRAQGSHYGVGPTRIRAFGGGWMAVFDYDGDGLDDILTMYPDGILAVQGKTGKTLLDLSTNGRVGKGVFQGEWTFMATPVVTDFLGNGKLQMLYGASTYRLGLLDLEGNIIWQAPQDVPPAYLGGVEDKALEHFGQNIGNHSTPAILPGVGDADGDGRLELLSPGHRREPGSQRQDFHCYDAATGKLKWKLPLPGSCFGPNQGAFPDSPSTPAVADIDGDGRDEAVFGIGKAVYVVGADKSGQGGEVRWSLELPDLFGPPTIADVKGDGKAEIVLVCADGYVYGIGPA